VRSGATLWLVFFALLVAATGGVRSAEPQVQLELSAQEATVGDRLQATLSVRLPADANLEPGSLGPRLGSFAVFAEEWSGPTREGDQRLWNWSGSLVSFRTGEFVVPPVRIEYLRADGSTRSVESSAVDVVVRSVLDPQKPDTEEIPELADLKPPASLDPDYSGLWLLATLLISLAVVTGLAWWLQRRYAAKRVEKESSPEQFQSVPPHVWAREALQALLDRHLVEQGEFDSFFAELSRIVKFYLGGRYRVDLMEHTTGEVPALLQQALTPEPTIEDTAGLLGLADRVKFAGERPAHEICRDAVDSVYEIVEATKPRDEPEAQDEQGAA
jgi:hypothetical protein